MDNRTRNLLDEALGLDQQLSESKNHPLAGKVVLVEDCVETSGCFVLHQLIKRLLTTTATTAAPSSSNVVFFLAFSNPFSHYDRVLRKLGCNLGAQREKGKFIFVDMLKLECPVGEESKAGRGGLFALFANITKAMNALPESNRKSLTIMIDDVSLMEVAAHGSSDHVLDFLHYCHTLTSEHGWSLVTLNHQDIYSSMERPMFIKQMEYAADVLVKVEPLATGLASDVHGQLTVLNRGAGNVRGNLNNGMSNFQFRIKENSVEYFYPGART
ncbi:Elongator complex protein 6 [Linum grandiflorum]